MPNAVGQATQTRLRLWQGEWSYDTSKGTPYLSGIIGKHSQAEADQTIQAEVLGTQGLTDIASYDSNNDTVHRSLSVVLAISTIYGPTIVTMQNYVNY